jgi:hypothetical protein
MPLTRDGDAHTLMTDASFERMRERKANEILCYGLGPISTSRIAQWQLALLLILREELKVGVGAMGLCMCCEADPLSI